MTASITSSPIVRAAPGRGASTSPSRRSAAKRCRHFDTVTGLQPELGGDLGVGAVPSAQASTIRQRNANACDDGAGGPSAAASCVRRRSSLIGTVGRPRRAIVNSFCQVVYLAERAQRRENSRSTRFLGEST